MAGSQVSLGSIATLLQDVTAQLQTFSVQSASTQRDDRKDTAV
jgi:hypothetical protein